MKKNIIKKLVLLSLIAGILFTACEDEFSEKDALDAQTIDVSIYVYDVVSDSCITNAEVTMIVGDSEETVTTNELGFAYFTKIKIATNVPVRVEKNNYVNISTLINISTDNDLQDQYTANIALYSLTQNTARIRGRLEIETDLTNGETEYVTEGTYIYAYLSKIVGSSMEFVATIDANGEYEFIVPADNYGISYELKYSSLELDQTIAINGNAGDPDFPETFPTIETINTVFNAEEIARSVPTVPSVYAYVNASESMDTVAIISEVIVDNDGLIIDLKWETGGYGYTSDSVDIVVVSLFDGSGAVIRVNVNEGLTRTVDTAYTSMKIYNSGSSYPTFSKANQVRTGSPWLESNVLSLKSGEIRIVNGDYGTGVNREVEIE
ncbi:MAG: hypothetical protein PF485_09775 [Bacteroidales bacterium]|jgi:hypothetical protein|nr:hypothetical protein [Bacteroidales bacterium]